MSSNNHMLSIIVPVYNVGDWFFPCLDSIVEQTIDPDKLDVILVDDGSNDGSEKVCDEYAEKHSFIRVFHQENSGYSAAPRNKGIEEALGDYVLFHDADDTLHPEACERMLNHAVEWDSDVLAVTQQLYWPETGRRVFSNVYSKQGKPNIPKGNRFMRPMVETLNSRKVFKKSLIDKHNLRFIRVWNDDIIFTLQALLRADIVSFANDYVYIDYVQRMGESLVNSRKPHPIKSFDSRLKALQIFIESIDEAQAEESAYPFLFAKIFEHPVYRLIATSIDQRDWNEEKDRLSEVWGTVGKYWTQDVAAEVKFTELCVIDAMSKGSYDIIPDLRLFAKNTTKERKNVSFLYHQDEFSNSLDKTLPGLEHLDSYTKAEILRRQLNTIQYCQPVCVAGSDGALYLVGLYYVPLGISDPSKIFIEVGEAGNNKYLECESHIVKANDAVDDILGIWYVELPPAFSREVECRSLKACLDNAEMVYGKENFARGSIKWKQHSTAAISKHLDLIESALGITSQIDNPKLNKTLVGLIISRALYPIVLLLQDSDRWRLDKELTKRIRSILIQWLTKADRSVLRHSEEVSLGGIIKKVIS